MKGAVRGCNPHQRKNPIYYPITATVAQTAHVLSHRNRAGNVHDSYRAGEFLRTTVTRLRDELASPALLEVRTDSAFQRDFREACDRLGVEYALKVPMWHSLNLRGLVKTVDPNLWQTVSPGAQVECIFVQLKVPFWNRAERIAIYRTRRSRKPAKGTQLNLFNPDDGLLGVLGPRDQQRPRAPRALAPHDGHGVCEKTIAELKSGFAYDQIRTRDWQANTAWQKLNLLAHNINVGFQVDGLQRRERGRRSAPHPSP